MNKETRVEHPLCLSTTPGAATTGAEAENKGARRSCHLRLAICDLRVGDWQFGLWRASRGGGFRSQRRRVSGGRRCWAGPGLGRPWRRRGGRLNRGRSLGGWRQALEEQRRFVDEPQRALVKLLELFDGRFIARELHQVAARQEIAQREFLG